MISKKPRKAPLWYRLLGGIFYLLFLGIALGVGTAAGWVSQSPMSVAIVKQFVQPKPPEEVFGGRDSITLLVLGCDEDLYYGGFRNGKQAQRLNASARADMILVAKLDFKNNRIVGVSIPRDLECALPGYGPRKINAYHAEAPKGQGGALMQQAVEFTLPGVSIDKVVTLDYAAFQRLINLVGGVEVKVASHMKYNDNAGGFHIDLKPGTHKLDGYTALCFVLTERKQVAVSGDRTMILCAC